MRWFPCEEVKLQDLQQVEDVIPRVFHGLRVCKGQTMEGIVNGIQVGLKQGQKTQQSWGKCVALS